MEQRIQENEDMGIDLVEILSLMLRKWWMICLSLLIGASVAFGYTKFFVTPQYQASSMIYVLGKSAGESINVQLSRQLTSDFITLAKSRPVIENVVDKLGLDMTYEEVSRMIVVENPADTSMLKTTVTSVKPNLAKDLANAMSDTMADRIQEVMATDKPSVVEKAIEPQYPVTPNTTKNVILGGLLGVILMMGILVMRFLMDDRIKNQEDVERYLQLHVLATIPVEKRR
ncbi:YveK family protein [Faecalimonas sp.]